MKHTFHKKLATPKAWLAVAVLGAIMIALPNIIFAYEDGLGTNVMRNIRIQTTGVIDLAGTAITNWNQLGSTVDVVKLQGATNALNTAITNEIFVRVGAETGISNAYITADDVVSNAFRAADLGVSNAFIAADAGISNAYITADDVVSNAFRGADTIVSNAFIAADGGVSNAFRASDAGISNAYNLADIGVSNAFIAADGGISNTLNTRAVSWDNAVVVKTGGGGALTFSNLYLFRSDGNWTKANATNSETASGLLGLALGDSIENNGLLLNGHCTNAWGFIAGAILYMDTNDGVLATSMPTGTNNIVRIVGYAINPTNIYFNPDRTYIQVLGQ